MTQSTHEVGAIYRIAQYDVTFREVVRIGKFLCFGGRFVLWTILERMNNVMRLHLWRHWLKFVIRVFTVN
jgi:hypothetical protein